MLKQAGIALIFVLGALNASATTELGTIQILQPGITVEAEFKPQQPLTFVNPLFWSVSGTCKVATPDPSNEMFVELVSGTGIVDNVELSEGDSLTFIVKEGDVFKLSAGGWAKVRIINMGLSTLKATCST